MLDAFPADLTGLLFLQGDWTMKSVYVLCAAVGGFILFLQTLLLLFGLGDAEADWDGDVDIDVSDGSFSVLSVRSVLSFVTFFGLAGWGAQAAGWSNLASLGAAVASGGVVMLLVAWLLHAQLRLQSTGNVDPAGAIGKSATVYLRIPGRRAGAGRITVSIQGRSMEYAAITAGDEIPTGELVRIASMPTEGTFDVVPLNEE